MDMHLPLARSGLAEGSQADLEGDSALESCMEVQQGNRSKSRRGSPVLVTTWPAGGVIARSKAAVGARNPAMVEFPEKPLQTGSQRK